MRWFNRLYLDVTRRIYKELESWSPEKREFLQALDIVFGNAYFQVLDAAGPPLPADYPFHAWKPLFEARHRRDVAPIQFALAGMNAHVNHDLAIGIERTCEADGVRPARDSPQYEQYVSVNDLIDKAEHAAKLWLLTDALVELDRRFAPVDDIAVVWSITEARAAAWLHAEVLWKLRDISFAEREYIDVLDRTTGLAGRALLTPTPYVEGAPDVVARSLVPQ